jgi:membrane-associated phospholipid phosphatase
MNILNIIKDNKKVIIISNIIIFYSTILCYQVPLIINLFFNIEPYRINLDFIDDKIPFLKFFIIFYVYYYAHIYLLTIYIGIKNNESFYKYVSSSIISCTIGSLILFIFPTYFEFNNEIYLNNSCLDFIFNILNSAKLQYNAFPSFHIIKTYLVFRYLYNLLEQRYYKILLIIITIFISLSTIFIKVHSVLDIIGSIFIVDFSIYITNKFNLKNKIEKFFNYFSKKY